MKKLSLLLSLIFLLASCAPAAPATATPVPTVDTNVANPAVGWVVVNERPGADSAFVFSAPSPEAGKVGTVPIGAQGDLLGFNATNDWVLVKFETLTGWMPTAVLIVTSDY